MRELILGVLYRLLAIKELGKELHYTFVKEYSLHELFDIVVEGLDDLSDSLIEKGLLGNGEFAPSALDMVKGAELVLTEFERSRKGLFDICDDARVLVKRIEDVNDIDCGTKAVLDAIAEKMNKNMALL